MNIEHPADASNLLIEKDTFHKNAYIISLTLDSDPSYVWQTLFQKELESSLDFWERKVVITGKELKLVTTPDNISTKLEWLEKLVTATNKQIDEYNEFVKRKSEEIRHEEQDTVRTEVSRWLLRRTTS